MTSQLGPGLVLKKGIAFARRNLASKALPSFSEADVDSKRQWTRRFSNSFYDLRGCKLQSRKFPSWTPSQPHPRSAEIEPDDFLLVTQSFTKQNKKPLAVKRKNARDEENFKEYFSIRIEKGIEDEDVWNMDEAGFCAGCDRAHWVITLDPDNPLLLIDPENREYVTSVEGISGGGKTIPPMLISCGI